MSSCVDVPVVPLQVLVTVGAEDELLAASSELNHTTRLPAVIVGIVTVMLVPAPSFATLVMRVGGVDATFELKNMAFWAKDGIAVIISSAASWRNRRIIESCSRKLRTS